MKSITIIVDEQELEKALGSRKALIFKNSPICPISKAAKRHFQAYAENTDKDIEFYMIDVIASREISKRMEEKTGITHQSPQVILIQDKKPVWHESHWGITAERITDGIEKHIGGG